MANSDQQVSGSTQINPTPKNIPIKNSAIHHKDLGSKTIREIINESIQDDVDPEATESKAD